jgi:hypothetical protein
MYPAGELNELEARKRLLCQRIALTRLECVVHAAEAAKPLEWIDRARLMWRRISPIAQVAAVPLALLLRRRWKTRHPRSSGALSGVWRLLPVILGVMKMMKSRPPV